MVSSFSIVYSHSPHFHTTSEQSIHLGSENFIDFNSGILPGTEKCLVLYISDVINFVLMAHCIEMLVQFNFPSLD